MDIGGTVHCFPLEEDIWTMLSPQASKVYYMNNLLQQYNLLFYCFGWTGWISVCGLPWVTFYMS